MDQLLDHVVDENRRPLIHGSWPRTIRHMLDSSFNADPKNRPVSSTFAFQYLEDVLHFVFLILLHCSHTAANELQKMFFVHNTIKNTLSSLRGGNDSELTNSFINRRRSHESTLHNSLLSKGKVDERVVSTL